MKDNDLIIFNRFIGRICKIGFIETLQTIWSYARNIQFGKDLPTDIETPPDYNLYPDSHYKRTKGVPEWELDIILLYSILYSPKETIAWYSIKKFNYLRLVVNDIRLIRDEIDKKIVPNKEDIFKEFFRIMHRQFIWQQSTNKTYTYRFYTIFNHPRLKELIKQKTNLDLLDLYRTGLLFTGIFINNFSCPIPIKSEVSWFKEEMFYSFLKFFSITPDTFQKKYREKFALDDAFLYKLNPLRSYPLLIYKNRIYCPFPNYIMWKITNGMFYDLVNEHGFDSAFGESFQAYCGLVMQKAIINGNIKIAPEIFYNKKRKRSTDWILKENETFFFIECKSKRLRLESITRFKENHDLEADIDKMIGFIFQVHKSINDAICDKIPNIRINESTRILIIILTLDEWHLYLDPYIDRYIKSELTKRFENSNLDLSFIKKYPFLIRSIGYFEKDCQIINKFGLQPFYDKFVVNSLNDLTDDFQYEDIFAMEIEKEFFTEI